MPGVVCIKKTRRLIHVNFFLQCTMEKSILFIELADGPTIGESKCKYNPSTEMPFIVNRGTTPILERERPLSA